jgi:hypothetical protein
MLIGKDGAARQADRVRSWNLRTPHLDRLRAQLHAMTLCERLDSLSKIAHGDGGISITARPIVEGIGMLTPLCLAHFCSSKGAAESDPSIHIPSVRFHRVPQQGRNVTGREQVSDTVP